MNVEKTLITNFLSSRLCLQESQASFNSTEEEMFWNRGGRAGSLCTVQGGQTRLCELHRAPVLHPRGTGTLTPRRTPLHPLHQLGVTLQLCTRVINIPVLLQEDRTSVFLPLPLPRWYFNNQATAIQDNLRDRIKHQSFLCSTPCFTVLFQSIYEASSVCFYLWLQLNLQETCDKHNLPTGIVTLQTTD